MTDFLGYGKDKRRAGNLEILSGRVTFQYAPVECSAQHSTETAVPTHIRVETHFGRCWRV